MNSPPSAVHGLVRPRLPERRAQLRRVPGRDVCAAAAHLGRHGGPGSRKPQPARAGALLGGRGADGRGAPLRHPPLLRRPQPGRGRAQGALAPAPAAHAHGADGGAVQVRPHRPHSVSEAISTHLTDSYSFPT